MDELRVPKEIKRIVNCHSDNEKQLKTVDQFRMVRKSILEVK